MLAQPLDTGNPKDEQFYLWTKAVLTIFLLMNIIPFQMSKPIFVGFRITLVGLVNYMYLRIYSVKDGKQFRQLPAISPNCINVESVCHVVPAD